MVLGDAGGPRDPPTHLPPLPPPPWPSFPNACKDKTEIRSRKVRKINPSRLTITKTRTHVESDLEMREMRDDAYGLLVTSTACFVYVSVCVRVVCVCVHS